MVALYLGYLQFGKKHKDTIKLRIENAELRKQKYRLSNQKKNIQDAFKIVFEQYEKEWAKDPQQMGMLKGIKELIDMIKNGGEGTRVGNWLRQIGRSDILETAISMVGDVATGDILGAVKTLIKQDKGISKEQEKAANTLIEMDYKDRAGAREMYKEENQMADEIAKRVIIWNLWIVFLAIVIEILVVIYMEDKTLIAIISSAIGGLVTALLQERQQVINFFFGSSIGSKNKDKQLMKKRQ